MGRFIEAGGSDGPEAVFRCSGDWTSANARALELEINRLNGGDGRAVQVQLDLGAIDKLDTTGAWLLTRWRRAFGEDGARFAGVSSLHQRLLDRINEYEPAEVAATADLHPVLVPFFLFGRMLSGTWRDIVSINAIQGRILGALLQTAGLRAPLRLASFIKQFELIILRAIPIVALISLVVGAIITQQTILQLRNFGAAIFVVDLAAILMFREIGVLLGAIMVAGRSGSAITAEIGAMRIREEYDALRVMGVDPYQALLLPRIVALVLGLPLLAFIGSMAGLAGAMLVAKAYGGIPIDVFIIRLRDAMTITSVAVGMIKAPFMGFLIGLIAAVEGMKVAGSSESLGRRTTSSVVKSIFVVIVADGLFAIFFAAVRF